MGDYKEMGKCKKCGWTWMKCNNCGNSGCGNPECEERGFYDAGFLSLDTYKCRVCDK